MSSRRHLAVFPLLILLCVGSSVQVPAHGADDRSVRTPPRTSAPIRTSSPSTTAPKTVVVTRGGRTATFTVGARTVTLSGPARTFAESTTTATVTSTTWVRLMRAPFTGKVDETWLAAALADRSPDVLAAAVQYVTGAAPILDAGGVLLAHDADFGPLQSDGTRQEGSDFNDYLGLPWTYPSGVDQPEADQVRSLDCSGYVRMVLGHRSKLPLGLVPDGRTLPRRAVQMAASAPGVMVIADTGARAVATQSLRPGDLVFFDVSSNDGTDIDHVGVFLGIDSAGAPRFVSSRKTANGPTLGDAGGRSTLSGTGLYALGFRAARRL